MGTRDNMLVEGPVFGSLIRFNVPILGALILQAAYGAVDLLVINSLVNHMGLMPSAGYGVAQKISSFILLIPSSVMQSVSAFVAQNIGAGKKERARQGLITAMITGVCVGIVIFCVGFFGGAQLSSLFTNDADVIA